MRILRGRAAEAAVKKLELRAGSASNWSLERRMAKIVKDVRRSGDRALRRYATELDRLEPDEPLRVSKDDLDAALARTSPDLRRALKAAADNIRRFCHWQKPPDFMRAVRNGIEAGQVVRPLASVGCYVPGGRYPLPSSLLMTVVPAQVAGVPRIAVVSPHPGEATLAAAALLGVDEFYRIGGAQAVAALAYGTGTIERVVKIVGPGNRYVTAAKKLVAFDCAIDMLAGPTEVLVLAMRGNARFIAADLVAQAEHDSDALALFVTTEAALGRRVVAEVNAALKAHPAAAPVLGNGAALLAKTTAEAISWANRIAPEHITVSPELVPEIACAGSIFVGDYSPQAMGDYASGPNHVLPTGGAARFRGGLSMLDFVKIITVQLASSEGLNAIAPVVTSLARAEGLAAHEASVRVRCSHA